MTNKRVLMGLAALGGLGALAFIGAIASWWWLAVAGLAAMLGVTSGTGSARYARNSS